MSGRTRKFWNAASWSNFSDQMPAMIPIVPSIAEPTTANLLASFSERVLRVKLASGGTLPAPLAAVASKDASGWWRIPIEDVAHVEQALARLRAAQVEVASLEVAEPELEEVFVKIMRSERAA